MKIATAATALSLALLAGPAQAQFVAKGSKGTLTVTYEYSDIGKKADKYEPAEWRVKRSLTMVSQLSAEPPQALSQVRPIEAAQMASIEKKQAKVAVIHKKMEPTMNDMMNIAEHCGEDEACIEKAIVDYASKMDPAQVQTVQSMKGDVAEMSKVDGPRYQIWRPTSETGSYSLDEFYRSKIADPGCFDKPGGVCGREETRKGAGALKRHAAAKGAFTAQLEFDTVKKDIYIVLPVPLMSGLDYSRQFTSNYSDEKSGVSQGTLSFPGIVPPITAAIAADARNASGTQAIKLTGKQGENGTLTIKWQFVRQ